MFAKAMRKKMAVLPIAEAWMALPRNNAQMQEGIGMTAEAPAQGLAQNSAYKCAKPNANAVE
jgi:hypothetical protein